MKIDPNPEILRMQHPEKTSGADKPVGKDEFSAMLEEAINNEPSSAVKGSKKPPIISSVAQFQFNTPFTVQNDPFVERTEKFLDILEEYRNKLLDPRATLRDIHPLIKRMETEKENLTPVLHSLPTGDGLKEILNDALITSSLEVIKFKRGDYLDS